MKFIDEIQLTNETGVVVHMSANVIYIKNKDLDGGSNSSGSNSSGSKLVYSIRLCKSPENPDKKDPDLFFQGDMMAVHTLVNHNIDGDGDIFEPEWGKDYKATYRVDATKHVGKFNEQVKRSL